MIRTSTTSSSPDPCASRITAITNEIEQLRQRINDFELHIGPAGLAGSSSNEISAEIRRLHERVDTALLQRTDNTTEQNEQLRNLLNQLKECDERFNVRFSLLERQVLELQIQNLVLSQNSPPLTAAHWRTSGDNYYKSKRNIESSYCYEKSLELDPDNKSDLFNLGIIYGYGGRGVKKDALKARGFFSRATTLGDTAAEEQLKILNEVSSSPTAAPER